MQDVQCPNVQLSNFHLHFAYSYMRDYANLFVYLQGVIVNAIA